MTGKRRVYQIAERIKEIVAQHLITTADPRFSLVTITAVMVSPDLRNAKVYWVVSLLSNINRAERIEEVGEALDSAQGHFRRFISKELGIRFVPVLRFYYDDTLDTVEHVERLMATIRPPEQGVDSEDGSKIETDPASDAHGSEEDVRVDQKLETESES